MRGQIEYCIWIFPHKLRFIIDNPEFMASGLIC